MGELIAFRPHKNAPRRRPTQGKSAEILFFMGVRREPAPESELREQFCAARRPSGNCTKK